MVLKRKDDASINLMNSNPNPTSAVKNILPTNIDELPLKAHLNNLHSVKSQGERSFSSNTPIIGTTVNSNSTVAHSVKGT